MADPDLTALQKAYFDARHAYTKAIDEVRVALVSAQPPLNRVKAQWCADKIRDEEAAKLAYETARDTYFRVLIET